MLARRTSVDVLRATSRGVAARPLARTASAPKTASGGFAPWPRHRVGRTAPQPTVAPGKNRPRYDFARRGAVLPQNPKPADKKKTTCDLVADQPGKVFVDFGSASFVAGLGLSGSVGLFKNVSTGSGGFFYTVGGNLGLEATAGLSGGFYRSAADLRGFNANINVSAGVSGSANFSADGRLVGASVGQGGKLGGSVSASETTFFGCYYNGG